jgi:SAM-dependent methyltransferase
MADNYVPDRLYDRLFRPWKLPIEDRALCVEDWWRVAYVCAVPHAGSMVDIGSGDGTLAAMVCSRRPDVTHMLCVEPDDRQAALIGERWKGWPIWQVVAHTLEIPDARHDGVLLCEVLEYCTLADGVALLAEAARIVRPGGRLTVTVPDPQGSRAIYPGHITLLNADQWRPLLADAGFAGWSVKYIRGADRQTIWLLMEVQRES